MPLFHLSLFAHYLLLARRKAVECQGQCKWSNWISTHWSHEASLDYGWSNWNLPLITIFQNKVCETNALMLQNLKETKLSKLWHGELWQCACTYGYQYWSSLHPTARDGQWPSLHSHYPQINISIQPLPKLNENNKTKARCSSTLPCHCKPQKDANEA